MRLKRLLSDRHADEPGFQRLCLRVPTVERLMTSDLELLARQCEVEHAKLQQVVMDAALGAVLPPSTARARHAAQLSQNALLRMGVPALDGLLCGGLRTGEVCEVVGAPGSGKTSLCLAACAAQAASSSSSASVLYLDTANGFRAKRLHEALRQQGQHKPTRDDFQARRLRVAAAPSLLSLLRHLETLEQRLDEPSQRLPAAAAATATPPATATNAAMPPAASAAAPSDDEFHAALRLVVVDCVFSAVVAEGAGVSKTAAGAQLARLQRLLRRLAAERRLAVLVTNLTVPVANADDDAATHHAPGAAAPPHTRRPCKPALGVAWQHTADLRLHLTEPPPTPVTQPAAAHTAAGAGAGPPLAPPLARGLCVLKSCLNTRGVVEGEVASAPVCPVTGLFV